ncbi:hypothetical protein XU18_0368 [Perkinsela sp. CCAP 1560/4]|nr:hypothetical protein XU18_0368 [Perkinsela sp. CCAP 1560/4]|eukprot:KNH09683.1 hypothetical protein XU18_0368 [Perkinsela sp. CCAP 1560/4]
MRRNISNNGLPSGLFIHTIRTAGEYGWCSLHEKKVPLGNLRKMKSKESQSHYDAQKANFFSFFRKVPHLYKKKESDGVLTDGYSGSIKNLLACRENSPCPTRSDSFCHLHNWRQDKSNLVTLSENPDFLACTRFSPCSVLITGKTRSRIKLAKTKFSQLARARCHEHQEPRKLCDMVWCLQSQNWVCGQWAPCDKELLRRIGANHLRSELCKSPGLRAQDIISSIGEDKAICATHNILREKIHLQELVPADHRLKRLYVCQREHHCSGSEKIRLRDLSYTKILKRNDRPGDWFCIKPECSARNACMDVYCMSCGNLRSSKCSIVQDPTRPDYVFPGCTPGDWGCVSCHRMNFSRTTASGVTAPQVSCHFCGSLINSDCPQVS